MTIKSSGSLSIVEIATEFADAPPHSINEFYGAADGIPASGAISFDGFYSKSSAPVEPSIDPYWDNVVLLTHYDGLNDSTIFTDEVGNSYTTNGTPLIKTAESKFGGSSLYVSNNSKVTYASNTGFAFGTGDFTVEAFVNLGVQEVTYSTIIGGSVTNSPVINVSETFIQLNPYGTGTPTVPYSFSYGVWYHVAITRMSGTAYFFVNGQLLSTRADTTNYAQSDLTVGGIGGVEYSQRFNGYIDEVRITKGVARYTSNFSVPTEAFPNAGLPSYKSYYLGLTGGNTVTADAAGGTLNLDTIVDGMTDGDYLELAPGDYTITNVDSLSGNTYNSIWHRNKNICFGGTSDDPKDVTLTVLPGVNNRDWPVFSDESTNDLHIYNLTFRRARTNNFETNYAIAFIKNTSGASQRAGGRARNVIFDGQDTLAYSWVYLGPPDDNSLYTLEERTYFRDCSFVNYTKWLTNYQDSVARRESCVVQDCSYEGSYGPDDMIPVGEQPEYVSYDSNFDYHAKYYAGHKYGDYSATLPGRDDSPHRYWRILVTQIGETESRVIFPTIEMFEVDGTGTDVTSQAFAIASAERDPVLTPATAAFGGNSEYTYTSVSSGAYWETPTGESTGHWIGQDFGAGNEKSIRFIRIHQNGSYFLPYADIQYSDDGVNWTTKWSMNSPYRDVGTGAFDTYIGTAPAITVDQGTVFSKILSVSTFNQNLNTNVLVPNPGTAHSRATLSSDGSKLFLSAHESNTVYYWNLGTPYDLTTYQNVGNSFDANGIGIVYHDFSVDGLHFLAGTRNTMYSWTLTTPWDLSTATLDSGSWTMPNNNCQSAGFVPGGNAIWWYERYQDRMYYADLSTPYQVSTATINATKSNTSVYMAGVTQSNCYGAQVSGDGLSMIVAEYTGGIYSWEMTTAWDFNTLTNYSQISFESAAMGIYVTDNYIYSPSPYNSATIKRYTYTT